MDMSNLFKSMAQSCFPKASIVADKYHVYRQVQWAFEDVRKEEQKKFGKSEYENAGRNSIPPAPKSFLFSLHQSI